MVKLLFLFIMIIFQSIINAGTIDPHTEDTKYIEYGSKFKCVLKLCGKDINKKQFCASAVAIKPRWILTAAHIGQGCESCIVHISDKPICVEKIIYHEKYQENVFGEYDIALGYTESDLGLDFYPELYEKNDEVGKICCMSGFGITGTFRTGAKLFDNHRRAGSNIIEHIDRKLLICTPSAGHKKTELEFIIASGDSGGGLFIDNKLAGINSCVIASDRKPDSTYGDESGHTRVSFYVDWINNTIKNEEKDINEKKKTEE